MPNTPGLPPLPALDHPDAVDLRGLTPAQTFAAIQPRLNNRAALRALVQAGQQSTKQAEQHPTPESDPMNIGATNG